MTKYKIEFIGEEGIDDIYERVILWDKGYFVIPSWEEKEKRVVNLLSYLLTL